MALPASGQISMNDIRVELGVPSQSPFGINEARLGTYVAINQFSPSKPPSSGQVSLSSWYSYCQNCGYNSGTFYYSSVSAAAACSGTPNQTLYWSGTLTTGTILYTNSTGNSEAAQGYWSDGTNSYYQSCPDGCYPGVTTITACAQPATLQWYWQNNNVVEGGGGFIQIYKNGSNIVYTADSGNYTTTEYSGSFSYNVGDEIYVYIYSYANTSYGTQTYLNVQNPVNTAIYNSYDTQFNPGSPSSETYTWTAVAGGIFINASSNSY